MDDIINSIVRFIEIVRIFIFRSSISLPGSSSTLTAIIFIPASLLDLFFIVLVGKGPTFILAHGLFGRFLKSVRVSPLE